MNVVYDDVKALVQKELDSANQRFPLFHSAHEGCAIIREEVEEAQLAIEWVQRMHSALWDEVKRNNDSEKRYRDLRCLWRNAVNLAREAIQIAAMCDKFNMFRAQENLKGNDDHDQD